MDGSSAEMDGSLAALFVEPRLPFSLSSMHQSEESAEELKHLLMRATMDLESTRTQAKLYEGELHHLKNLLRSARQERDEAREEVFKLKENFLSTGLLSDAMAAGMSNNPINKEHSIGFDSRLGERESLHIQHSSKASSSPGQQYMQLDCISSSIMLDSSTRTQLSDLHWDLHDLPELRPVELIHPDMQSNNLSPHLCPTKKTGILTIEMDQQSDHHLQQQQHENAIFSEANELIEQEVQGYQTQEDSHRLVADSMSHEFNIEDVLPQGLMQHEAAIDLQQQSQLAHHDHQQQQRQQERNQMQVHHEQVKQHDPYHQALIYNQQNQETLMVQQQQHQNELHLSSQQHPIRDSCTFSELPRGVNHLHLLSSCDGSGSSANMSIKDQLMTTRARNINKGSSVLAPLQPSLYAYGDLQQISTNSATTGDTNMGSPSAPNLMRLHLPEPPESDPEVMLRSLPEKGKLLQAVMQAGPLLQTLLLAGPLPQWRHPPPATLVDSMENTLLMQRFVGNNNNNMKAGSGPISSSAPAGTRSPIRYLHPCNNNNNNNSNIISSSCDSTNAAVADGPHAALLSSQQSLIKPLSAGSSKPNNNTSAAPAPMLNTSTNLSYSNRLLRSSALLPRRLVFRSDHRQLHTSSGN